MDDEKQLAGLVDEAIRETERLQKESPFFYGYQLLLGRLRTIVEWQRKAYEPTVDERERLDLEKLTEDARRTSYSKVSDTLLELLEGIRGHLLPVGEPTAKEPVVVPTEEVDEPVPVMEVADEAAGMEEDVRRAAADLLEDLGRRHKDPRWGTIVPALESALESLEEILRMPGGPHRESALRSWQEFPSAFIPILEQLGAGGRRKVSELEALVRRIEEGLAAGSLSWKPTIPERFRPVDPASGGRIESLADLVVLVAALRELDLPLGEEWEVQERIQERLATLRGAVESWISDGELPAELAKEAVDPDAIGDRMTATRWRAIEEFCSRWLKRSAGQEPWPPATLDAAVADAHAIEKEISAAGFRRHDALDGLTRRFEAVLYPAARWARLLDLGDVPRDPRQLSAAYAEREFNLCRFDELPDFVSRVETLWSRLRGAAEVTDKETLALLAETQCLARSLAVRSANRPLEAVHRALASMARDAGEYGKLQEHQIRLLDLDDLFERALAPYARLDMNRLLTRLRDIDAFFITWQPICEVDEDATSEMTTPATEPEEDRMPAPPGRDIDEVDWSLKEFLWNVGSACDQFSGPYISPLARAIGVQLRALHRWTAGGRRPAEEQVSATGAFFVSPSVRRLVYDRDRRDYTLQTLRSIDAYVQRWPAREGEPVDEDRAYPTRILSPEHATLLRGYAIFDLEACLAARPDDRELVELHLALLRSRPEDPAFARLSSACLEFENLFPEVPDFLEELRAMLHAVARYLGGERVASREVFDQLLETTGGELRRLVEGFPWAERRSLYAELARQLRAMKRWSRGERVPTADELRLTRLVLARTTEMEGNASQAELVRQLGELDVAFRSIELLGAGPEAGDAGVESREDFLAQLDDVIFEVGELGYYFPASNPTPLQAPAVEIARKLELMRELSEPGRSTTERDRQDASSVLDDVGRLSPELCPTIPDYREELRSRVASLTAWFDALMRSPAYARQKITEVEDEGIECFRVGAVAGTSNVFVRALGDVPGIYRCGCDRVLSGNEEVDGLSLSFSDFLPTSKGLELVVPAEGRRMTDLTWSPGHDFIAFARPDDGAVAWVQMRRIRYLDGHAGRYDDRIGVPGEHGRAVASAYVWAHRQNALLLTDHERGMLCKLDVESGESTDLIELEHDTDHAPRISVSSDRRGLCIVLRTKMARGPEVRVVEYRGRELVTRTVREFDDDRVQVLPFHISANRLGLSVISPAMHSSTILSLGTDGSNEEVLVRSSTLDPPFAPTISRSGRHIAFFRRRSAGADDGPSDLVLFDVDTGESRPLIASDRVLGAPRFGDESIFIEGSARAVSVWIRNLDDRRLPMPKF